MKFRDTFKRSFAKAIAYRLISVAADWIIIYGITHRYEAAIAIIILSNTASTLIYIVHERAWNLIKWGKVARK